MNVVRHGHADEKEEMRVAKISTVILGLMAIVLGIAFEKQNVAFMVGLAFAIAASANFPALLLSMLWRKYTTAGAVASILSGGIAALVLIGLSPTVMTDVLGKEAIFPLTNPAIISIPLAFVVGIVISLIAPEGEASRKFDEIEHRLHLGVDD